MKHAYLRRILSTLLGLFLLSLSSYLIMYANVGVKSWDAFALGLCNIIPWSYGTVFSLTGFVILGISVLLKETFGLGTILNILLVGPMVDMLRALFPLPPNENFFLGILIVVFAQVIFGFASYFYISPGLGCGPRDALMVALSKRFKRVPLGVMRGSMELFAVSVGWALGAKVGIGTIISIFALSIMLQATFKIMRFDVKTLEHESMAATWRRLRQGVK